MQLRSSCTSQLQRVLLDAGLGHSNEAQGVSVGAKREGTLRGDKRARNSPINSLRIFRQTYECCLAQRWHAKRGKAAARTARRDAGHNGPQRVRTEWY